MRSINWIFVYSNLTIAIVFCKQPAYKIKPQRLEVTVYDPTFINASGSCYFLNRTHKAINLTLDFKKALTEKQIVFLSPHKWINNNWVQYRSLEFTMPAKDFFTNVEWYDLPGFLKKSFKPPMIWPLKAIKYVAEKYVPNVEEYPPYIPLGNYKVYVIYYYDKTKENKIYQLDLYMNFIAYNKYDKN